MLIFFLGFGWVCGKAFLSIADDVVKQRYSDVPSLGDAMISGHENMVSCKSPWNFLRSSPMLSKLSRQNLAKEAASGKLRIRTRAEPEVLRKHLKISMKWGANISSCISTSWSDVAEVFRCRGDCKSGQTGWWCQQKSCWKSLECKDITEKQQSWESNS